MAARVQTTPIVQHLSCLPGALFEQVQDSKREAYLNVQEVKNVTRPLTGAWGGQARPPPCLEPERALWVLHARIVLGCESSGCLRVRLMCAALPLAVVGLQLTTRASSCRLLGSTAAAWSPSTGPQRCAAGGSTGAAQDQGLSSLL